MPILSIDFETFSTLDLRQVGADLYTSAPDFTVTVVAWAIDDGPVKSLTCPTILPDEIVNHLAAGHKFRAWNAAFEWLILRRFGFTIPWAQVSCTMQKALYAGLPASLAGAGAALGLPPSLQKDAQGQRLMLQMARPRLKGGKWHADDPAKLAALEAYCKQDVVAERTIARLIPQLPSREKQVSALDHEANLRGIALDQTLIRQLAGMAHDETARLNHACSRLTSGRVTSPSSQTAKLSAWLASRGINASEGLDKTEVAKLLANGHLPARGDVRQVLEIRQEAAKSSTRKLHTMQKCSGPDDRVRGQLLYYGAARTGRFAGRLIQPQNMPRPTLPPPVLKAAIDAIRKGRESAWIDAVYGAPLDIVAQGLRSCLVPGPGKTFVAYDFRQIEARVLSWFAGQKHVLKAFAEGRDVYVVMQKAIGLPTRHAAKIVVLAAGFGMGAAKFQDTAKTNGLELTELQAKQMIDGWREANPEIVSSWYATERAARQSLFWPGNPVAVDGTSGKLTFTSTKDNIGQTRLAMKLPSSRDLFYRNVRIEESEFRGGRLTYDGVHQEKHKWMAIQTWGGKLVENAVQATARDVLVDAALRVDQARLGALVLSIHDELIWEVDEHTAATRSDSIRHEVEMSPEWAPDLPIASEGGIKSSYGV